MTRITVEIPLATVSEANSTEHWQVKAKRHRTQKATVAYFLATIIHEVALPVRVTLTRISQRKLDDDNLRFALKYIRDAVADQLHPGLAPGRADDKVDIEWCYAQAKGPKGVKIEIEEVANVR